MKNFILLLSVCLALSSTSAWSQEKSDEKQKPLPFDFSKVLKSKTESKQQLSPLFQNQARTVTNTQVNGTGAVTHKKDDPQARMAFELLKTRSLETGKIPEDIRLKELKFMRAQKAKLNIPFATGDITTPWENRGPKNVGGRTRALAVDVANENIILAGGISGGMWRSTDQGVSWTKTTGSNDLQSVTCIAQDTRVGQTTTWYYGTGEVSGNSASGSGASYRGDGIFKSTDNGVSWSLLAATSTDFPQSFDQFFDYNNAISVDPTNGNVLVANYGGIYLSDDGGASFTNTKSANTQWSDVIITSTGMIYSVIDELGVFSSPDGTTWTDISPSLANFPLNSGERKVLALAASNENIFYLLGEDASNGSGHSLWKFNETSDTWTDRSASIPQLGGQTGNFDSQGGYDLLIKVKPDNENFVIIGGTNLFRSTDGFASSSNTTWIGGYSAANTSYAKYPDHHPDQHSFVYLSSNKAISGNDGGVQITSDITTNLGGNEDVNWVPLNNGYLTTQVYAISIGSGNQVLAGFQDNGTWLTTTTDNSIAWTEQFSGDGAYSAMNSDGTMRYMSSQNANIYRVNYNGGADDITADGFTYFTPEFFSTGLFITPFYLDPTNDELFYLGGEADFYVNTQASTGSTSTGWKTISLPGVSGVVSEMSATSNIVYVGTSGGNLYKITNPGGAETVDDITDAGFSSGYISGISSNPFNSDEVLITFSNYSVKSVFYTTNGGATWTDVSGSLEENPDGSGNGPSIRTANILGNGDRYFVGTSTGLYSTTTINGGSTIWTQENSSGIGEVVVEHLVSRPTDGLLVAGTHGNGIYSAKFSVSGLPDIDLAATNITEPVSGVLGASETITATLENKGGLDQSGYSVTLNIDGNNVVTDMPATIITAGGSYAHIFSVPFDFSTAGDYNVTVTVTQAGDTNNGNDSYNETITSITLLSSFPYNESFETITHGWEVDGGVWVLGTPAQTNIVGTTDGTEAWATGLSTNYPNNAFAVLKSPFFDFSSLTNPQVSFDLNYSFESGWDGLILAYRTDAVSGFVKVPKTAGVNNWYNNDFVSSFGSTPAWSASSNGEYKPVMASLDFLAGEPLVQLALILASDGSITEEGVAMDVFQIKERPTNDLATTEILSPSDNIFSSIESISIRLKNLGVATQSNFDVLYYVDNVLISTETVSSSISSGAALDYTFNTTYNFSLTKTYDLRVEVNLGGDEDPSNNELSKSIESIETITSFPYIENFDANAGNLPIGYDTQTTTGFEWLMNTGQTISTDTGPNGDHTTGSDYYVYTEASGYNFNDEAILLTRQINLTGLPSAELTFYYHMYGANMGNLEVNLIEPDNTITNLVTISGEQQTSLADPYLKSTTSLNSFIGKKFRIQFKGIRGNGFFSDIAIDDILIGEINISPSAIALSSSAIDENIPSGSLVGTLTTTDANGSDTHTYIISGTDAASFQIGGAGSNELQSAIIFDFETKSSYSITVRTTDQGGLFKEEDYNISINNKNEPPTGISLTNNSVPENLPTSVLIGVLSTTDENIGDTHIYSLVSGTGDADNASFNISGMELVTNEIFDFETKSSYTIRLNTNDGNGGDFEEVFAITITDGDDSGLNNSPTNILLSSSTILENQASGTIVGNLTSVDPDVDTHTYTIISGDFSSFYIDGTQVKSSGIFNFESKNSYNIKIRTVDSGGAIYDKIFTINVGNENEAPTAIMFSNNTLLENQPSGTLVGTLSTTDVDSGDSHTYSISGTDATSFKIGGASNNELQSNTSFSFETKSSYQITVTSTDSGGKTVNSNIIINIININTAPTLANPLANQSVNEDASFNFQFAETTFNDIDPGDGLTYTATLADDSILPSWLNFSGATRTFSGTPLNEDVGVLQIKLTATDNSGDFISDQFDLTVTNTNDSPVISNPITNKLADEDISFSFQFNANVFTDVDANDQLSYTATQSDNSALPTWLTFTSATRTFSGTPLNSDVGVLQIKLTAADNDGATVSTQFGLSISNTNDSPVLENPITNQTTAEDDLFSYQFSSNVFSDVDATDILTYTATLSDNSALPNWLSFTSGTRTFSGTPLNEHVGTITIKITATDSSNESIINEFSLEITNTNDAPIVANPIAGQATNEDETYSFQFNTNVFADEDSGDSFTYTATKADDTPLPTWLVFDSPTRTFSGTPLNDDVGVISLKVTATDNEGVNVLVEFNLEVLNINDAPVFSLVISDQEISKGSELKELPFSIDDIDNTANEIDVNVSFDNSTLLSENGITLTSDGNNYLLSITPNSEEIGETIITLTVTDGDLDNETTFKLKVTDVLGLEDRNFSESINVYPNPAYNKVTINFPKSQGKYNVEIVDLNGKKIDSFVSTNQTKIELDVSNYSKGNYIIKIQSDKKMGIKRFIKN